MGFLKIKIKKDLHVAFLDQNKAIFVSESDTSEKLVKVCEKDKIIPPYSRLVGVLFRPGQ